MDLAEALEALAALGVLAEIGAGAAFEGSGAVNLPVEEPCTVDGRTAVAARPLRRQRAQKGGWGSDGAGTVEGSASLLLTPGKSWVAVDCCQ